MQCISNGATSGNMNFKAIVVQDLYQNFDAHSIAGSKLSEKLIGPSIEITSNTPTEPTKEETAEKETKLQRRKTKASEPSSIT